MLYFVAIVAPVHINDNVMVWKRYMEEHYGCKVALRSPAHITLVPPISMSAEKEVELSEHLSRFAKTQKRFTVSLQHFDSFPPRVIFVNVIPDESLLRIKQSLDEYLQPLKTFRFKKEQRPFHPHITIANRDLTKGDHKEAWAHFKALQYEASFTADCISLLKHNNKEWQIAANFPITGNSPSE